MTGKGKVLFLKPKPEEVCVLVCPPLDKKYFLRDKWRYFFWRKWRFPKKRFLFANILEKKLSWLEYKEGIASPIRCNLNELSTENNIRVVLNAGFKNFIEEIAQPNSKIIALIAHHDLQDEFGEVEFADKMIPDKDLAELIKQRSTPKTGIVFALCRSMQSAEKLKASIPFENLNMVFYGESNLDFAPAVSLVVNFLKNIDGEKTIWESYQLSLASQI